MHVLQLVLSSLAFPLAVGVAVLLLDRHLRARNRLFGNLAFHQQVASPTLQNDLCRLMDSLKTASGQCATQLVGATMVAEGSLNNIQGFFTASRTQFPEQSAKYSADGEKALCALAEIKEVAHNQPWIDSVFDNVEYDHFRHDWLTTADSPEYAIQNTPSAAWVGQIRNVGKTLMQGVEVIIPYAVLAQLTRETSGQSSFCQCKNLVRIGELRPRETVNITAWCDKGSTPSTRSEMLLRSDSTVGRLRFRVPTDVRWFEWPANGLFVLWAIPTAIYILLLFVVLFNLLGNNTASHREDPSNNPAASSESTSNADHSGENNRQNQP